MFRDAREIAAKYADEADLFLIETLEHWTRQEMLAAAKEKAFPLGSVNLMAEVVAEAQFAHRRCFSAPVHVSGHPIYFLKAPYQFSDTPIRPNSATAPTLSSTSPVAGWAVRSPHSAKLAETAHTKQAALSPIRVLDLGWVWSGPMVSAALADLGAQVIKVEHRDRLDNARLRARPTRNGVPVEGPAEELSSYFHQNNRGKLSVTINIKTAEGARIFRELATTSDVIIENLTPGVFDRSGVGYSSLAEHNPRLVWLSMSSAGQTGPLSGLRAYAPIMTAIAGLQALVGYPDDPVVGELAAGIGDPNAGSHGLLAVLAALVARESTGRGQFIDMSQIDAALAILCEPLAEYLMTGHQPDARGATHPRTAPHGHYPCNGADEWVAIVTVSDDDWKALARLVGGDALASNDRFRSASSRVARRDELDALIAGWTYARSRQDAVSQLRRAGVVAEPVLSVAEAQSDSQFADLFRQVIHGVTGSERLVVLPWHMSRTPPEVRSSAPQIGEHTLQVLSELGLSPSRLAAADAAGALR
jgi:crotonobetainyl-CoA:carnitine CoA-transferase CaiB-like acyl-CoA transferase